MLTDQQKAAIVWAIDDDDPLALHELSSTVSDWNCDLSGAAWEGATPLMHALCCDSWDAVEKLIELGADPNFITPSGHLIWHAVEWRNNDQTETRMHGLGASLTLVSPSGESLLRCLVSSECSEFRVKRLIDGGAPVNQVTGNGENLVHAAVAAGSYRALIALVAANVDLRFGSDRPNWVHPLHQLLLQREAMSSDMLVSQLFKAGARLSDVAHLTGFSGPMDALNASSTCLSINNVAAYEALLQHELATIPAADVAMHVTSLVGARRLLLAHQMSADEALSLLPGASAATRKALLDHLLNPEGQTP